MSDREEEEEHAATDAGYQSMYWEGQEPSGNGYLQNVDIVDSCVPSASCSSSLIAGIHDSCHVEALLPQEGEIPKIQIINPEKHGEGFKDAFVTYEHADGGEFRVRRRYQDFLWLLCRFGEETATGMIVPPLPDKNPLGFLDRFSPEYIRKRQQGLERFLRRLVYHPRIGKHTALHIFLTRSILSSDPHGDPQYQLTSSSSSPQQLNFHQEQSTPQSLAKLQSPTGVAAVMEQISDAVISVFSKGRPVEERFRVMKRIVQTAEGHFDKIAALQNKLVVSLKGLSDAMVASGRGYSKLALSFAHLERILNTPNSATTPTAASTISLSSSTIIEPSSQPPLPPTPLPSALSSSAYPSGAILPLRILLGDYGGLLEERSVICGAVANDLELNVQLPLSEYGHYCRAVRQALKLRDQKQFESEDLADYLAASREELEGSAPVLETTRTTGEASTGEAYTAADRLRARKTAVINFFTEKMDTLRGVDPISARQQRISRLERRVEELEETVQTSRAISKQIDATIESEFAIFGALLNQEIRKEFAPSLLYAWHHHHQQEAELWSNFIHDTLCEASHS